MHHLGGYMSEQFLDFKEFTHKHALNMGLNALEIVKERQLRRIGIRIVLDDILIFQYLMDGKNEDNYLRGKEKVVKTTGLSSMFVYDHQNDYQELELIRPFLKIKHCQRFQTRISQTFEKMLLVNDMNLQLTSVCR